MSCIYLLPWPLLSTCPSSLNAVILVRKIKLKDMIALLLENSLHAGRCVIAPLIELFPILKFLFIYMIVLLLMQRGRND